MGVTEANDPDGRRETLLAANADFYRALETADIDLMTSLWQHSSDVSCAHPGRAALLGWGEVLASWKSIFSFGGNPQIIATEERVVQRGQVGWITLTENMISDGHTGAATAVNIFEHDGQRWRVISHHAGPVLNQH